MNEKENEEFKIVPQDDARLIDFVKKLGSIPLSHSEAEGNSSRLSQTTRDRLIYDCGYAAGAASAVRSQAIQRRLYRLVGAAATVAIALLGAYAWQLRVDKQQVATHKQPADLKNHTGEEIASLTTSSAKELATQWVAAQNLSDRDKSQLPQLTPASQSIDAIGNTPSPTVHSTDPVTNPSILRTNSFTNVLEWDV